MFILRMVAATERRVSNFFKNQQKKFVKMFKYKYIIIHQNVSVTFWDHVHVSHKKNVISNEVIT